MAKRLLHNGYFNDLADIKIFNEKKNADEVIRAMLSHEGAFHNVENIDFKSFGDFEDELCSLTKDGKWFVVFPSDAEVNEDGEDIFIDIYEVWGSDGEYTDGHCDEWCPECECEVELPRDLGVYRCPNCGQWVVNCSMCYLADEGRCSCKNCPLSFEAKRRNDEERNKRD